MEKVPQWVVVAAVALVAIVLAWAGQLAAEWIPGISSKWHHRSIFFWVFEAIFFIQFLAYIVGFKECLTEMIRRRRLKKEKSTADSP
jgi:hypothetical protein